MKKELADKLKAHYTKCPKCGARVFSNAKTCRYCGINISYYNEQRLFEDIKQEEPQVDFDMLKDFKQVLRAAHKQNANLADMCTNMHLFFEMMSKSSSFAHKAHIIFKNK